VERKTKKTPPGKESKSPKSPRPRKRKGSPSKYRVPKYSGFITLSEDIRETFRVKSFGPDIPPQRGAKIRKSTRWYEGTNQCQTALNFPYINRLGQFTGTTLFRWSCNPSSFVASVTSTIAKRLEERCLYYNPMHIVLRNSARLVRVAFYYAFSHNNYFWDRVLFFTRNLEKYGTLLHKLLLRFLSKTDETKRFVYSHVCSQTQWLLFRAERPRDKSAKHSGKDGTSAGLRLWSTRTTMGGWMFDTALAMSSI